MGSGHFPPDLPRSALAWRGLCLTLVCTRTCCPTRWDRTGRETTGERHGKKFAAPPWRLVSPGGACAFRPTLLGNWDATQGSGW